MFFFIPLQFIDFNNRFEQTFQSIDLDIIMKIAKPSFTIIPSSSVHPWPVDNMKDSLIKTDTSSTDLSTEGKKSRKLICLFFWT